MYFPGLIFIYRYISNTLTFVFDLGINDTQRAIIVRPFIVTKCVCQ